ncbi:MAG: NAD(P)-dependent oxidoreductase [Asgard group archaeon]|nr:NAD(P)-dependent oxidoreductase [Asgard group archaeon]
MAILITGGTGFVGGTLVNELVNNQDEWGVKKEEIYVLVRESSHLDELKKFGVNLVVGDLTDADSLERAVKGKEIIFHLGAVVLDQSDPDILHQVNVLGTEALLNAFAKEKMAKKFVSVSTWGVYGYRVKPKPMKETQKFDPTNDYHKSKMEAEKLVWEFHEKHGINVSVARLPMILGPGDTLTTPRVIQAFFDDKVKQIGNGNNIFSGVHVRDAARAILLMGLKKEENGSAYNVKSFDISQKDYWRTHMKAINYEKKIPVFPYWLAYLYAWSREISTKLKGKGKPTLTRHRVMRYGNTRILDISKIQKELQYKPKFTDGNEVIRNAVKWLNENNYIDYETKTVHLERRWEDAFKKENKNNSD